MKKSGKQLVWSGHFEGLSFLVLLFIAMPLKYMYGFPQAVRIVGGLHGALFVLFSFFLLRAHVDMPLNNKLSLKIFILSFVPFGTFFIRGLLPKQIDYLNI